MGILVFIIMTMCVLTAETNRIRKAVFVRVEQKNYSFETDNNQ